MRAHVAASAPGMFWAAGQIEAGGSDTLDIPDIMVNVGGVGLGFYVPETTGWDPTANDDGTVSSMSLGDDIYVYAVQPDDDSGQAELIASKNATTPDGFSASESRRIGGFHVGRTRPASERYSSSYTCPTEIIANSVWDLHHRPSCDPAGMVEIIPGQCWIDIYLSSEDGSSWPDTVPLSEYDATPLTGSEGYNVYYDMIRLARNAGKRIPTPDEWLVAAYGTPQGATDAGGRVKTGQHSDYGFDCVSALNVDQPSGNVYQTVSNIYDRDTSNDWSDDDSLNTGKDESYDHGEWYGGEIRVWRAGANWSRASRAGARAFSRDYPWFVASTGGLRCACDSLKY